MTCAAPWKPVTTIKQLGRSNKSIMSNKTAWPASLSSMVHSSKLLMIFCKEFGGGRGRSNHYPHFINLESHPHYLQISNALARRTRLRKDLLFGCVYFSNQNPEILKAKPYIPTC
jgi:hypothetical protein